MVNEHIYILDVHAKTTIHEYYSFVLLKNDIRSSRQPFYIFSISQTLSKQIFSDDLSFPVT